MNSIALTPLRQPHIDYLLNHGVPPEAMIQPAPVMLARGIKSGDGHFEEANVHLFWLVFEEQGDFVFWQPRTGEIAIDTGRAFALGQDNIDNPGATALGAWLRIFADPLEWLQAKRNGLVVLRWEWAFDMLRDVERIAVSEQLLPVYTKYMKPRLPKLAVIQRTEARAA